jgi:hypothetical protein
MGCILTSTLSPSLYAAAEDPDEPWLSIANADRSAAISLFVSLRRRRLYLSISRSLARARALCIYIHLSLTFWWVVLRLRGRGDFYCPCARTRTESIPLRCPCVATGQLNSFYQANGQKQSKWKSATEVGSITILCSWYHIYIARVEPLSIIAIYKSKTHLQHRIKIIIHHCNLQEQNTSTYLDKIHAHQHSTTVFLNTICSCHKYNTDIHVNSS